jgi:hypothetical protein
MRVIKYKFLHVYFMFTTYRRRWHRVYRVIMLLLRVCQKTRCVGHRMTRTNRRWGGLSTQGGFDRLGRTLLPCVGRVSHTRLAHKEDHPSVHLEAALYMKAWLRQWRHCYRLKPRWMTPWSSACDNSRLCSPPIGVLHASPGVRQSPPANGGSTSSVSSASACMINIV